MKKLIYKAILINIILFTLACHSPQKESNKENHSKVLLPPAVGALDFSTDRALERSWNLVSFPIKQITSIETLLQTEEQYENIQSVWYWDAKLGDTGGWKVYPDLGEYPVLQTVTPDGGYWVKSRSAFDFTGTGVAQNQYNFAKGWNLIGISHSATSVPLFDFFSQGDFWQDSCGQGDPILNVWSWQNHAWVVYFPDDANRIQFNTTQGTQFEALTTIEPGMGLWVNASRDSTPPPVDGCDTTGGGTVSEVILNQSVSGISLGSLNIMISGGNNVDYSQFTTSTSVESEETRTLEISSSLTESKFPAGDGIVLAYSGLVLSTVSDFDRLIFETPLYDGMTVEVYDGSTLVASNNIPQPSRRNQTHRSSQNSGNFLGEYTGDNTLEGVDIHDAVFLISWIQLNYINDISLIEARAKEIYSNVQGNIATLPTVGGADFTGNQIVDIHDLVYLVAWVQVGRIFDVAIVEARAKEIFSNIQGNVVRLPGSEVIVLSRTVSGVSLANLSIRVSTTDWSSRFEESYSTTTIVHADGNKILTKSPSASQVFFPNRYGVVLNYDGTEFQTVSDFNTLTFSGYFPDKDVSVSVYDDDNLIAWVAAPPTVQIGDTAAHVGETITLNTFSMTNPNEQKLSYQWSVVSAPEGGTVTLSDENTDSPSFVADTKGNYEIMLTLNDSIYVIRETFLLKVIENQGYPADFVELSADTFTMGAIQDGIPGTTYYFSLDERPAHSVTFSKNVYIMDHEVTVNEYKACVLDGGCTYNGGGNYDEPGRGTYPMTLVSWYNTQDFIQWKNQQNDGHTYRLCTEAEWEYAALAGGSDTISSCGTDVACADKLAEAAQNTHPVKTTPPNAWGIYDMYGNVTEWVSDWYSSTYYSSVQSGVTNPEGPSFGSEKVVRGSLADLRASERSKALPTTKAYKRGFRVCLD